MKLKTILERFNKPETHLIISGYPERDGNGNSYGISWYTKETIEPLAKEKGVRFVVLCETNGNNDPVVYQSGKILVLRIFDQRHPTLYPRILRWLTRFNNIKNVYVHSEFSANGGMKNFTLLLPFLFLIKLTGRNVTYFAHNFVSSLQGVSLQLGIQEQSIRYAIYDRLLNVYNQLLVRIVDRIVVMDEAIEKRVTKFVKKEKVITVPMFVKKKRNTISSNKARAKIGIKKDNFILLYFGFVTWYKGADWIVKEVQTLGKKKIMGKNIRLIIAGGKAYSLRNKKYYKHYYEDLKQSVENNENITMTGFLPEKDIEKYFKAADVVAFPYRGLIGASGAMTYALTYKKPFIISRGLEQVLNVSDYQSALYETGLQKKDIVFDLSRRSFRKILMRTISDTSRIRMRRMSAYIKKSRDYTSQLDAYYEQIYNRESSLLSIQSLIQYAYSHLFQKDFT